MRSGRNGAATDAAEPKRRVTTALLALALSATSVPAGADAVGIYLGRSPAEVAASLHDMGYGIEEIEVADDDDEIEAEVHRDGRELEVEISRRTGRIVEIDDD